MPYADNNGVKIYYEVEGEGPPLVLAHGMGFGANLTAWRSTGYTEALKNDYTLILFDIRGHGRSDKASAGSNPAEDIVAVLDALDIEQAHFLGYSMGASAGFKQAISHADRFKSFILGGMTPGPWPEEMIKAMDISRELVKLRRSDPEAYFVEMERMLGHSLTPEERNDLLARDTGAGSAEQTPHRDEPALTEQDLDPFYKGAQESVQHMPRAIFISLGGLNHITAFSRSDVIVRLVRQFLAVVTQM